MSGASWTWRPELRRPERRRGLPPLRQRSLQGPRRVGRGVLGEVPPAYRVGGRELHPRGGGRDGWPGSRPCHAGPFQHHRRRRRGGLERRGPDHAGGGRGHLPLRRLRSHQGLAARRLPAAEARPHGDQPQPPELLRRGRAGRLLAGKPGAGHHAVVRQDVAGAADLLLRRPPLPAGRQLRRPAGQLPARRTSTPTTITSSRATCTGC